MAKTESVYLSGKAKWVRTSKPDDWGNWKVTLYFDNASLIKMQELNKDGVLNTIKKDEDGYYCVFRRPQNKKIKGELVAFTPPEVLKADGTPLTDQMIGNGSDVTIKLEKYGYRKPQGGFGAAVRLASIRVDNLVPFTTDSFEAPQRELVAGLKEQPAPNFAF